jgi:Fe-S cluster biogenesis protein NfuA
VMATTKQARLENQIRKAIAGLLPLLRLGSSDVELIEFDATTGVATLRVAGDCPGCEMSAMSLLSGIEAHLKQRVPEIRMVRAEAAASA